MNQQITTLKKLTAQIALLILIVGCSAEMNMAENPTENTTSVDITTQNVVHTVANDQTEDSITNRQRELEAQILATTLRLELKLNNRQENQVERVTGHGTIIEGRYLLTHNHYGLTVADFQNGFRHTITLYRTNGEIILEDASFITFEVTEAGPETLIFDFGENGGEGLFTILGLPSATMANMEGVELHEGMQVAQVDWDGYTTHIDWVEVQAVQEVNGVPVVLLDNFVKQGASGGGIFSDGTHLGNNWSRSTEQAKDSGEIVQQYSTAALNDALVLMNS